MPTVEFVCEDGLVWSPLAAAIGRKVLGMKGGVRYGTLSSGIQVVDSPPQFSPLRMWNVIHTARSRNDIFQGEEIFQVDSFLVKGEIRSIGGFAVEKLYKKALQKF